jgi:hypothetical protein
LSASGILTRETDNGDSSRRNSPSRPFGLAKFHLEDGPSLPSDHDHDRSLRHRALIAVSADSRRNCPDRDRTQTLYVPKRNRRCKNVAACTNNIASDENSAFIDHCGRSILYGFYVGTIQSPIRATVLFMAFVVAHRAVFVKAYEWRQDVLYGHI